MGLQRVTSIERRDLVHPCFDMGCSLGRIHLPVAPKCNIQCGYCSRKFDCANESRPGVTSSVMTPEEAIQYYLEKSKQYQISVAGIAGPGDPLANWEETYKTFYCLKKISTELKLCLSTNGMTGAKYVKALKEIGVEYITITINSLDAETSGKIYDYVFDGQQRLRGVEGGKLLLEQQEEALCAFSEKGIHIKVNMVIIPGINESQVISVAALAKKYKCDIINLIPLISVEETRFAQWPALTRDEFIQHKHNAGIFLPVMSHCQKCRADAVGYLT